MPSLAIIAHLDGPYSEDTRSIAALPGANNVSSATTPKTDLTFHKISEPSSEIHCHGNPKLAKSFDIGVLRNSKPHGLPLNRLRSDYQRRS